MADLGRPAKIAIGFAIVALLTSLGAVIVVIKRSGASPAPLTNKTTATIDRTVAANDVTKLKRDVVEKVEGGVRLKDASLRQTLGLEPTDVITAINGRTIKREFDVYDAVLGMSMMDATVVYVEILREKQPLLVRWKLDGDLRSARRDTVAPPRLAPPPPSPAPSNPFIASPDPLVDSIVKVDTLHYDVPRSTIDRILANPDAYARQARIVPAIRNGQPDGFRLYAITAGSLWSAIGLQNGDTIRSINGHDLSTPDRALERYRELKDATELKILIVRRGGDEETITLTIK